ncbi:response regulator [Mesoterricola silvestris]|uniref:Chemotaxis protein CheY n=1 Tax=Mesoterricola silvestris TaxID=2927979 RepID=A0AA48K9S7_9BACT|nr:response regulator [Mesoterricola silvestris]BDU73385.1 chemotaxis protein CheY [Mesoterricola silvestris]
MKILSVDDSTTMRRIIGRVVGMLGYDFAEASNGVEALDLLARDHADIALVIMDINMPEMDGITCLQSIKADPALQALPVMMVTTESDRARVIQAVQAGAANYVTKPFSHDDLVAKIASTLGSDEF